MTIRERFSDRIGATRPRAVLQLDDVDLPLRNSIWNFIHACLTTSRSGSSDSSFSTRIARLIGERFLKWKVDDIPQDYDHLARKWVRERYEPLSWYQVYNLIEFLVDELGSARWFPIDGPTMILTLNAVLEEEGSAYRFIQGALVPLSNASEVKSIEEALGAARARGLDGVRIHLETALAHLATKPTPDFRNSVKESISAVESIARLVTGAGSLKAALQAIDKVAPLHPALVMGLNNLYGYTSDDDGIRHAILESPTVGFDEAKFMLVSCSAFANFLIGKAAAAGLLK